MEHFRRKAATRRLILDDSEAFENDAFSMKISDSEARSLFEVGAFSTISAILRLF